MIRPILPDYGTGYVSPSTPDWRTFETGTPWTDPANDGTMIDRYRKGDFRVTAVTTANVPISGATVTVQQIEHAFWFGVTVDYSRYTDAAYLARITNGPWNSFNAENHDKSGVWDLDRAVAIAAQTVVQALKPWRMRRGHVLSYPLLVNGYTQPASLYGTTHSSRRAYWSGTHLPDKTTTLRDAIDVWELFNEIQDTDLYSGYADANLITDLGLAAVAAHGRLLYLNNYTDTAGLRGAASSLLAADIPVWGLGFQAHGGGVRANLGSLGLKNDNTPGSWATLTTEADYGTNPASIAAEETEGATASFANPSCVFYGNWGIVTPSWNGSISYFDESGNPTARYSALLALVRGDWWTSLSGTTNGGGYYAGRGFFGQYTISCTVDGVTKTRTVELAQTMPEVVFIF